MEQFLTFGESIFEDGLILFVVRGLLILAVEETIVRMIRRSIRRETEQRGPNARTPIRFIGNVSITVIRCVVVFLILKDIKPLSGIGKAALGATSIITIVVGLAAQEAFGNLIAGFFLAMYQPVRLGDLIVLKNQNITGTVEEITLRHTVIKTYDGTRIVVPNARMNSEIIENRRAEGTLISRMIILSVAYDTDLDQARKVITDCVTKLDGFTEPRTPEQIRAGEPAVNVVVTEFLDSGIELSFRVYNHNSAESYAFGGTVREAILKAFRANGIEIPYPTRSVAVKVQE